MIRRYQNDDGSDGRDQTRCTRLLETDVWQSGFLVMLETSAAIWRLYGQAMAKNGDGVNVQAVIPATKSIAQRFKSCDQTCSVETTLPVSTVAARTLLVCQEFQS